MEGVKYLVNFCEIRVYLRIRELRSARVHARCACERAERLNDILASAMHSWQDTRAYFRVRSSAGLLFRERTEIGEKRELATSVYLKNHRSDEQ